MPTDSCVPLIIGVGHMQYDRVLLEEVLRDVTPRIQIVFVSNSELMTQLLHRTGKFAKFQGPYPSLILGELDETTAPSCTPLETLRLDPRFKTVPFVVLTSRSAAPDIHYAYSAGANAVTLKPLEYKNWKIVLQAVVTYWLEIAARCSEDGNE